MYNGGTVAIKGESVSHHVLPGPRETCHSLRASQGRTRNRTPDKIITFGACYEYTRLIIVITYIIE